MALSRSRHAFEPPRIGDGADNGLGERGRIGAIDEETVPATIDACALQVHPVTQVTIEAVPPS